MRSIRIVTLFLVSATIGAKAQSDRTPIPPERIATAAEVAEATRPDSLRPLRVFCYPYRKMVGGMERGSIAFERNRVRERIYTFRESLARHGVEPKFGGSGEGSGIGGGAGYHIHLGEDHSINLLGLITLKNYQEAGLNADFKVPGGHFLAESTYQWRPQENYYGKGHDSSKEKHSQFALRQTWAGLRYELQPWRRLRTGALYRMMWSTAEAGTLPAFGAPEIYFRNLPGYRTESRLSTTGIYLDMDGIRQEYQLGGAVHLGASYNRGLSDSTLRYFSYETQLEGRLPVVGNSSVLVAQGNVELNRLRSGSSAIPFYMLPHIGGSSTLRGFALDRFYGTNLMLLSLEYRYLVHPNIQALLFFDEGQIFDRTADLGWLHWHRNYGFGFRFRTATGTFMRIEYGHSSEGFQLHITYGDRVRPPLRGPMRYGAYKR